jgi:hypothetical protein
MDYLCAIYNTIALIAKGNERNETILNEDIPTTAISSIVVLETSKLRPTRRLASCYMRK